MKNIAILLLAAATLLSADKPEDRGLEFLTLYYKGEYQKAHDLLPAISSDSFLQELWDHRIHSHDQITGCSSFQPSSHSTHALARMRIGHFEEARKNFTDDWISCWARAIDANWNADVQEARKEIARALSLQPDRPELLFLAGDIAPETSQTIDYFSRFLKTTSEDAVKRNIAEYSIAFLKKTEGMELNIISADPGAQEIETDYLNSGPVISAMIDSTQKLKVVLDTGAGSGLVLEKRQWTPKVVNDVVMLGLGKNQVTKSKRMVLDRFHTGTFSIRNPTATESDSLPFREMDGLVGTAIFSTHRILLPLKSGKNLVLLPYEMDPEEYFASHKLKFRKRETVPFYMVNKLVILKGRIKKSPSDLDILLDTGADRTLISQAAARKYASINYPLSMQLRRQASVSGVGGKADSLLIAENVDVGIGGLSRNFNMMLAVNLAEASETLELELDVILGRDFLEGYTLLLDYANRQVTFLK